MQIITLTTDFGTIDPYAGIIKGVIYSIYPYAKIVDISHEIAPQDIWHANWVLESSYKYFPKGTIHVCVVDPGVGSNRKPLLIESKNYFFIGPDNGIFTGILEKEEILNVIELKEKKYWLSDISHTFHGKDVFSPVAAYLARGILPKDFGITLTTDNLVKLPVNSFVKNKNICIGIVKHIDRFGNLITNIPFSELPQKITGKVKNIEFKGSVTNYAEAEVNKLFGIKSSNGYLEIFTNKGNAARLSSSKVGDKVEVKF